MKTGVEYIKVVVDGMNFCLEVDEARELYEQLREVFGAVCPSIPCWNDYTMTYYPCGIPDTTPEPPLHYPTITVCTSAGTEGHTSG